MTVVTLDPAALESYLPHRGVNLMPDEVDLDLAQRISISRTRVHPGDARGREMLGRDDGRGGRAWSEPFIAELMALTGVPLLHERLAAAGHTAVFSMISRIEIPDLPPLAQPLQGLAKITRDRGAFTVFETRASAGEATYLTAEVMSGSASLAEVSSAAANPFPAPPTLTAIDPGWFAWKHPRMRFVDGVVSEDPAAKRLTAAYSYPTDHPFIPGHFPQAALMMGVTQWQAVADAAWVAWRRFACSGPVVVNGTVRRHSGEEVLDVRDLLLAVDGGLPRIRATKRIAFRAPVRPGDGLLIDVSLAPAP